MKMDLEVQGYNMKKVDVVINVFGKPWQTICTLKSLLKHSGEHIDKIFIIKEKEQPYNENINFIFNFFKNLIVFEPSEYNFTLYSVNKTDENERFKVRYQYGIEKSDKDFVFITHNDVLYEGDIIGDMLDQVDDCVGIGPIGQCWNCPANSQNLCNGEKFNEWNPSYNDIKKLKLPHVRTTLSMIDKKNPKPLPECRLNEWSCLLNRKMIISESIKDVETPLFGEYGIDLGTEWFKNMFLKGYKFKNYSKNFEHSYWSELSSGHQSLLDKEMYDDSEKNAKEYYNKNFR
jgi:hypothetical protein